ncbi:type II toxin-antitoxin system Phd/YefM family antitoxin [Candidatus Protofrankia datiscae]|nr:type II toxin-antitoxin system prevent-host-death family antitoxin [Candidatus Protofrankia datiscae]
MTASEASWNFSALLSDAEHGEAIVITRSGRRIAVIMLVSRGSGEALREVFHRWGARAGVDDRFVSDAAAVWGPLPLRGRRLVARLIPKFGLSIFG